MDRVWSTRDLIAVVVSFLLKNTWSRVCEALGDSKAPTNRLTVTHPTRPQPAPARGSVHPTCAGRARSSQSATNTMPHAKMMLPGTLTRLIQR